MLRFCDSFDHYGGSFVEPTQKYDGVGGGGQGTTSVYGRFGQGYCAQFNRDTYLLKILDAQDTWIVGMALRFDSFQPTDGGGVQAVFSLYDGGSLQCDLRFESGTGKLVATRNGTVLGTGSIALSADTWHYVEFKCIIDDSAGVIQTQVDGVLDLNLSGIDTKATANATADRIYYAKRANTSSPGNWSLDDIYACDGQTSASGADDFLGDVRVEAIFPTGNGNSSQFDGSDGNSTDNYLLVDEAVPNDDTDYVEDGTVGEKDTYVYGNVTPASGTVYGVQVIPYAKKTDAGARAIATIARLSSTEDDSADESLSTGYAYIPDVREEKPGGGQWTISDVNSAEFGVKVAS